jgi:hypothetical protein
MTRSRETGSHEMRNHKAPENWARGHYPQSYGNQGYKEGHAPIGQLMTIVIWEDDRGPKIQSRSNHRYGWAILQVQVSRYLESSGVKIPKMRSPKILQKESPGQDPRSHEAMERSHSRS